MPIIKCSNCGANIPPAAAFCPSCGAPKPVVQPVPQQQAPQPQQVMPAYQPMTSGADSFKNMLDTIFAENIIFIMILLGVLLACIGGLMLIFAGDLTVYRIGLILNSIGFVFMGVFLLIGGMANRILEKYVRFGMIVGGAIMLTFTLSALA